MPIEETVTMVITMLIFFVSVLAITGMVLSHRREMAKIKHGKEAGDQSLRFENTELRETVSLMQDRIAVLEQIATDPARRTAEEIEKLR